MNEYKEECFKRFENTQKYKKYNTDELIDEIFDLQQKLDQYKNNWEELKKMFEVDEHFEDGCYCNKILNKMKELEEKNND